MLLNEQELLERIDDMVKVSRQFAQQKLTNKSRLRLQKSMEMMFKAQQKLVLKHFAKLEDVFEEAIKPSDLDSIYTLAEDRTHTAAEKAVDKAARDGLLKGSKALISELNVGMSFDLSNPAAVDYLHYFGAKEVTKINDTTRKYINGVVKQSADEGWSYNRTAKAIGERYSDMWVGKPQQHIASRAHFIAVTEAGNAYMEGQLMVGFDLDAVGLAMEKYWSTMRDDRVSDGCMENESKGWIDVKNAFPSGHHRPLRFPGCRCDLLQRVMEPKDLPAPTEIPTFEPPPSHLQHLPDQKQVNAATEYAEDSSRLHAFNEDLDHPEFMRQSEENFQRFLDDNPISVRADSHNAMSIVDEGRFKTQFETNTSNGTLDQGFRASAENKGLGIPKDIDPSERPIYGYVSHIDQPELVEHYGDMEFVLKDSVKDRTTVTASDSLYNAEINQVTGTPARNSTRAGMDGEVVEIYNEEWDKIVYVEAQIQGGVTMADVDHLILHYNYELTQQELVSTLKWFKDRGLQV